MCRSVIELYQTKEDGLMQDVDSKGILSKEIENGTPRKARDFYFVKVSIDTQLAQEDHTNPREDGNIIH